MTALAPVTITRPPTPEEQLAHLEEKLNQKLPEYARAAFMQAQLYKGADLEDLHNAGAIKMVPQGPRVMLRSIAPEDAYIESLAGAFGGQALAHDARRCIAHEILAFGAGVAKVYDDAGVPNEDRPEVGWHCFVLSTVADRASKDDNTCRIWTVHVEDISLAWPVDR